VAKLTRSVSTWSNALTLSRLVAGPFFFCALAGDAPKLAGLLFWAAVATDIADGRVARARGESSHFGGMLDHATDAIFVALGLAALALRGAVPAILPVLVLGAFVQYVLDSRIQDGRGLRGSALGRWNGVFYFVPPGIVATRGALDLDLPSDEWVWILGLFLVASTLLSIAGRARAAWFARSGGAESGP